MKTERLSAHRSLLAAVVLVLGAAPRFLFPGFASALFLHGQPAASRYAEHDDGFRTNLILVPARKIGIVHMTNGERYPRLRIDVAALRVALGKNENAANLRRDEPAVPCGGCFSWPPHADWLAFQR